MHYYQSPRHSLIPASAGVILVISLFLFVDLPYPRKRGGDPKVLLDLEKMYSLSPQARGDPMFTLLDSINTGLIPASAGVILTLLLYDILIISYPRKRGGDPRTVNSRVVIVPLSPQARG